MPWRHSGVKNERNQKIDFVKRRVYFYDVRDFGNGFGFKRRGAVMHNEFIFLLILSAGFIFTGLCFYFKDFFNYVKEDFFNDKK